MTTPRLVIGALVATALLAGCGTSTQDGAAPGDAPSAGRDGTHVMADGTVMGDAEMGDMGDMGASGDPAAQQAPSEAAAMICSDEIAGTVRRTFDLDRLPFSRDAWHPPTYLCDYALGDSTLRLSVEDLQAAGPGRAHFRELESRLPGAVRLHGLESMGLPSFETRAGDVVVLKDHKTLRVDPSGVSPSDLPPGYTRRDVAYAVASAVVACWSE